ncbi:hypothetical protein [Palleronia abyssalis]|uniref:Uncharacterized protein n=1 Tax=Palleronia abyssalis TaxID=1501240 RepID=A0A2R8BT33_9RHOB|nr:hypothetical protein [Palleronia abyssalis]SPJ23322.1 hypothetical protein PAA8504_01132 [Palleronia abyssalis]
MKKIIALATVSLIAAPAAFAEAHMDESMTMMTQRLQNALADCNVEVTEEEMMNLSIADVSGIIIATNSDSQTDKCTTIEGFLQED